MKSAIVFGGAGFIGTHLLKSLRESGDYAGLTSVDLVEPSNRVEGVNYVLHDVRKPVPDNLGDGFTEAYNLAAVHRTPGHNPHEYYETNVAGASNVCDFARRKNISRILFTSSIAVYGPGEDMKLETTMPKPTSDYGHSKLLAEGVHRDWQKIDASRHLVIVRPAVVFGAGENGNFTRLAAALKRGFFFFPGRRDTVKSCGYVGELVASMAYTIAKSDPVILYNFCYPTRYTIDDICSTLQSVAALPAPRGTVPRPILNTVARSFEVANRLGVRNSINRERIAKLVTSTNVKPGYLIETGYSFKTDLNAAVSQWKAQSPGNSLI